MPNDNEVSIKATASADIRELIQYAEALERTTAAMHGYAQAAAAANRAGGAGGPPGPPGAPGGGTPPGTPPGSPPAPPPPPVMHTQAPGSMGGGGGLGAINPSAHAPGGQRASANSWMAGVGGRAMGAAGTGASFLNRAASTALGVGLGTGITGFLTAAPQRYMALDTVITQLSRKFRDAGENAAFFGSRLGYTISETAQLAEALGAQTNAFDRPTFQRYAGFARFTGADPGVAMQAFGGIQQRMGRGLTEDQLVQVLTKASERGMAQGRLGEYLQGLQSMVTQQFQLTGATNLGTALAAQNLPSLVYGAGDPRRNVDTGLAEGLHATLTGPGAMQTYMMRAMGFGREGGPGYIEMRKRLEAGIFDASNVVDLFGSFQDRGMGRGAMFRAIESVAGGNLKAHQIESLVDTLGTEQGLLQYGLAASEINGGPATEAFLQGLTKEQRALFQQGGFLGISGVGISTGEEVEVQIEKLYMEVGKPIAEAIPGIVGSVENIVGMLGNITGVSWGELIPRMVGGIEKTTALLEQISGGDTNWRVPLPGGGEIGGQTAVNRIGTLNYIRQQYGSAEAAKAYGHFLHEQVTGDNADQALEAYRQRLDAESRQTLDDRSGGGG